MISTLGLLCLALGGAILAPGDPPVRMFVSSRPAELVRTVSESRWSIQAAQPFTQAIVSWSVDAPAGAVLRVSAQADFGDHKSKWFRVADWSPDISLGPRRSINGQKDSDGDMQTDTLVLARAARRLNVRIEWSGSDRAPLIHSIDAALSNGTAVFETEPVKSPAWGKTIEVPKRSQMNYPGGNVLCSPTSVSMVLWHWSTLLGRPALDRDVPMVQAGVYDQVWKGTGNWAFNAAYAGQIPGLRSYVSRFRDIRDIEAWIDRGLPVVTSVSYGLLKGKGVVEPNDGHLVVLLGFTAEGDPIFNDPGKGTEVRQTYKRKDFEAAWAHSTNTVYLIYPRTWQTPIVPGGSWEQNRS